MNSYETIEIALALKTILLCARLFFVNSLGSDFLKYRSSRWIASMTISNLAVDWRQNVQSLSLETRFNASLCAK